MHFNTYCNTNNIDLSIRGEFDTLLKQISLRLTPIFLDKFYKSTSKLNRSEQVFLDLLIKFKVFELLGHTENKLMGIFKELNLDLNILNLL